ncbi:MAG: metallophosphoesterase [Mycobacterium sp.]
MGMGRAKGQAKGQEAAKGLDIIGDVHGYASKLEERLTGLGYRESDGAYRHSERMAVFVGDLVDRGPEQLRTLEIAKGMVDAGSAHIVMGNHEFNALAYSTERPGHPGSFLREHNQRNDEQHHAFIEQLTEQQHAHYLEWFWTLPLWLDLGDVRVVHACWHEPSMKVVEQACGGNRLLGVEHLLAASTRDHPLYEAVEILLKGPEVSLVDYGQPEYLDKGNHPREKARIRWWNDGATTLREIAVLDGNFTNAAGDPYPELPDIEVGEVERSYVYNDEIPVFYGHYWRNGVPVHLDDWTTYTACVDFSAGKGGTLVAYRWDGEPTILLEHYVPHGADVVEQSPAG